LGRRFAMTGCSSSGVENALLASSPVNIGVRVTGGPFASAGTRYGAF
jgi:hypothetical protein